MKTLYYRLALAAAIFVMALSAYAVSLSEVRRDKKGFPLCLPLENGQGQVFIKWRDLPLSREIDLFFSERSCRDYDFVIRDPEFTWSGLSPNYKHLIHPQVFDELLQVQQKTNELRKHFFVSDYFLENPIENYTVETNRQLTRKYGQVFSALVFKQLIEKEQQNKILKEKVLYHLADKNKKKSLSALAGKVRLVVSFGLGWEESYKKSTAFYISDFLKDIKSLGLPVTYLKKDPYGTIPENVEAILPQLQNVLNGEEDIILISLCKGTPELLAVLAEINRASTTAKGARVLGHINLSGMLSGAIFSDFAKEIIVPKLAAPLLKVIPFKAVRENARMIDALELMKSSIVEETLKRAAPFLNHDLFTINVTGAPMSDYVLKGNSPMKPVIHYGLRNAFIDSANDGFLELPSTLLPASHSLNQATLVMDSTHMLSDGHFEGHALAAEENRQSLYFSVIETVIKKDPLLAGLLQ